MISENKRKELVKKFGTAAVNNYVHIECINPFTKTLPQKDKVIELVWFLKPDELIGKYKDIDKCDHCSKQFVNSDPGYLCIRITSIVELNTLLND